MSKELDQLLKSLDTLFVSCKLASGAWPNTTRPGEACPGVSVDVAYLKRLEQEVAAVRKATRENPS